MQMCCMPTQISIKKEETKKIKYLLEWVMLQLVLLAGQEQNRDGSEVGGILTTAHREFGGCAHCCAGKLKCREQDQASPRRRGHARSGIAEE